MANKMRHDLDAYSNLHQLSLEKNGLMRLANNRAALHYHGRNKAKVLECQHCAICGSREA